ncbi:hypothetical protein A9Q81_12250 [Gammaproteobacteria bacterium 42_54_T18]|nr:hypothetical protein A9Q81_12250 [Gammaproteobacteria bacterium 42_54_T18]
MKQVATMCILCAFVLLLAPVWAQADVYRWVDEKGQVHYGDRSPAGAVTEKIDMPVAKVRSTEAMPSELNDAERRQRQKRIVETLAAERKIREGARQKIRDDKAAQQAKCETMRIELEESKGVNFYYRRNEKGERVFISDKERKLMDIAEEKKYRKDCSGK